MKRFKSIVLAALAVFVAMAYIPMGSVFAQSSGSAALSIPPRKNYIIDPGETIKDTLSIRNADASNELNLSMKVIDFTYTDESGTPKLLLDDNIEPTPWSLKPYLNVPETMTVNPGSTNTTNISVSIPDNLGAGSYYSAIIYSTSAPDGGNVGLSASGVTLVFVTVPGDVDEQLNIKKFGLYDAKHQSGDGFMFITAAEPEHLGYTLENLGNITEAPTGNIQLRSMWGQEYTIGDINPTKALALIGQTRTFQTCIKAKETDKTNEKGECESAGLWPGYYKASIDILYGQNGNQTQEITKTASFWYLPLWFLIAVLILVLAIAFAIWRLTVAVKTKTRRPKGRGSSRMMRR